MSNFIDNLNELGKKKHLRYSSGYKIHVDTNNKPNTSTDLQKAILNESNQQVVDFIDSHLNLSKNSRNILFNTGTLSYNENVDFDNLKAFVYFKQANDIQSLNSHFKAVNTLLPENGIYIGKVETYRLRYARIIKRYGKITGNILRSADFIFNRVIPRLRFLDAVYSFVTANNIHVLSEAEVLGRLVYCGFTVIEFREIDGMIYFVGKKTKEPVTNCSPSYYPLIKLQRVGKDGKMIGVYKFRTMHPYSEFLQDFVIKLNGYNKFGKPANDFRVTAWGKIIRKLWIDELPQLVNLLKGEMKLVGVRPLSLYRFNELPKEVQEARIKNKPGCFPPYVALCMSDENQNIEAEKIYIKEKSEHPYTTDIKYFFMAFYNILTNRIKDAVDKKKNIGGVRWNNPSLSYGY